MHAPHPCRIVGFDWRRERDLFCKFVLDEETTLIKETNISNECRKKFGRLTLDIREKIIAAAPESITVKTTSRHYPGGITFNYKFDSEELNKWLNSVAI